MRPHTCHSEFFLQQLQSSTSNKVLKISMIYASIFPEKVLSYGYVNEDTGSDSKCYVNKCT